MIDQVPWNLEIALMGLPCLVNSFLKFCTEIECSIPLNFHAPSDSEEKSRNQKLHNQKGFGVMASIMRLHIEGFRTVQMTYKIEFSLIVNLHTFKIQF